MQAFTSRPLVTQAFHTQAFNYTHACTMAHAGLYTQALNMNPGLYAQAFNAIQAFTSRPLISNQPACLQAQTIT